MHDHVPFTQYKLGVWVTWRKWDTFLHWSVYVYSFGQYSIKYKTVTCFLIIFFFTLREEENGEDIFPDISFKWNLL